MWTLEEENVSGSNSPLSLSLLISLYQLHPHMDENNATQKKMKEQSGCQHLIQASWTLLAYFGHLALE